MRHLIPYAGKERVPKTIDPRRALEMRSEGRTWANIAEIMSEISGRTVKPESVKTIVRRYMSERGMS